MTGFGQSELKIPQGFIRVEIKTINHKFFEMVCRLPGPLSEFEDTVRKMVTQEIRRGKISLVLSCPDPSAFMKKLVLNEALAKEIYQKILRLKKILGADPAKTNAGFEAVLLKEVLNYPDVLTKESSSSERVSLSKELEKAVALAVSKLRSSRLQEGKALGRDILNRILEIKKALNVIKKRIPVLEREYRKTLEAKMKEFLPAKMKADFRQTEGGQVPSGGKEDEIYYERLTLEVAMYVKNSDISEEMTRMKSHMDAMKKALKENGEIGRKIDFIAQEMYRESNTMGAKSSDVAIANSVIEIKSAIEKIREQAQNVE
ncbi:MAG: hypothetical protein AUJ72_04825 [Candidatus Omnitrophica bacterium CG1_02_46_14]|nr:MAG: hypothetical protein AUJ72_04825 [Candidatus Omnitrophica bacterium CG1_02_46_14]